MSNWHFAAIVLTSRNFKKSLKLKLYFSKNAYSIYCTFYSTLFSTIFSQFLSLPLSFFYTTLPKLRAFIFYARLLCYPFFLTLPDSWLLVKHAYISDGFKPATGLRSAGRIFLNYERGVVESCMYTRAHVDWTRILMRVKTIVLRETTRANLHWYISRRTLAFILILSRFDTRFTSLFLGLVYS